jgi:hypothetical protein
VNERTLDLLQRLDGQLEQQATNDFILLVP